MAVRGGPRDPDAESEPVLLETDGVDITFTLDDGEEITFPVEQLQEEIDAAVDEERDTDTGELAA